MKPNEMEIAEQGLIHFILLYSHIINIYKSDIYYYGGGVILRNFILFCLIGEFYYYIFVCRLYSLLQREHTRRRFKISLFALSINKFSNRVG